jgi:FkbM family methyltransferase
MLSRLRSVLGGRRDPPPRDDPGASARYSVASIGGLDFVIRPASVDRENLDWVAGSLFVETLQRAELTADDTVVDLGCHIGAFALMAARAKPCRVIGFEPDKESLRLARANAVLNSLDQRVAYHHAAVGGYDGNVTLHQARENWGHTTAAGGGPYNQLTGHHTTVRQLSLESALAFSPTRNCAFLKFNTEGAEFAMVEAASPRALAGIRTLVGELHYDLAGGADKDIVGKLRICGFSVEVFPDGELRAFLRATRP